MMDWKRRVYWNRIRSRWDVFSTFEPGKLLYSSRSMVLREVTKPDIWYEGLYHSSDPGMSRRLAKWALDNAKAGEDAPYRVAMPALIDKWEEPRNWMLLAVVGHWGEPVILTVD